MKKIIVLLFSWCILSSAFAQDGYVKHVFEVGRGDTYFPNWKARSVSLGPLTDAGYSFFFNKNWGVRIGRHFNNKEIREEEIEKYKYLPPNSNYYRYEYIDFRSILCKDLSALYRINYKRHNILFSTGLSFRKEFYRKHTSHYLFYDDINYRNQDIGYVLSLSYQYRIFRNFGVSGDLAFRQSKNIPNTFTYNVRLAYMIWNKKKEKESK